MRGGSAFSETVGNSVLSVAAVSILCETMGDIDLSLAAVPVRSEAVGNSVISLATVLVGLETDMVLARGLGLASGSGKRCRELLADTSNIVLRFHLLCSMSMNSVGDFVHESSARPATLRISAMVCSQQMITGVSTFCGLRHQKKYDITVDTMKASVNVSMGLMGRPAAVRPIDPIINHALCTTVAAFAKRSAFERSQTSSRVIDGRGI